MKVKYICKICNSAIVREDRVKHLKKHNFDTIYLTSGIALRENFTLVKNP